MAIVFASGLSARAESGHAEITHPEFTEEQRAFFENEVRPLLAENCFKCHGGTDSKGKVKVRSGLQLISRRGVVTGSSRPGPPLPMRATRRPPAS